MGIEEEIAHAGNIKVAGNGCGTIASRTRIRG